MTTFVTTVLPELYRELRRLGIHRLEIEYGADSQPERATIVCDALQIRLDACDLAHHFSRQILPGPVGGAAAAPPPLHDAILAAARHEHPPGDGAATILDVQAHQLRRITRVRYLPPSVLLGC